MWKNDVIKAVWILLFVAVISLAVNWIRTPVLHALAEKGAISRADVKDYRGVFLNDDWSHKGRPEEQTVPVIDPNDPDGGELNGTDPSNEIKDYLVIDFEQIKMLFESGECIFIDARSPEEYEYGHIPGAINWPHYAFDEYHEIYRDLISPTDCIVIYCENETCDFSADLAQSLVWEYYQEIYRYTLGIDDWIGEFMPVVTGEAPYDDIESGE